MSENDQCVLNRYFSTNPLSSNWFNIADPQIIDKLPEIEIIPHAAPLLNRQAIKGVFKAFGVVRNEADGLQVTFPAASAGKMLYQSGTDIRAIASSFKLLFEKSIRAWDEKEVPMPGHKFHFNVSAYSNYVAKFRKDGVEYFIRFTIRKIGLDSSVHASTISEVSIYIKTEGTPADSHLENPEDGQRAPFIDHKIAFFLSACQPPHSNIQTSKHLNIRALISRLHARLGDFWWYSLMIFMAARAADCLNVFVGLWLVPKYVPPSELGAVMPLTNFASFLAIPIGVFASTFRQELSNLAVNREFGKLKTLMRGVFIATAVFFFVALVISHFVLPHYLERIRIAEGSLGMLIIAYSFINAMSPIFSNPLQALKKFKATTVISLVGAPVRFLTMLATIPLRALSGYFVGQASVPSFSIVTSVIALRQELSVKAERYWTLSVVRRFSKLFLIFGVGALAGGFAVLVETTVLRQRLPEVESAAYYMMTRFSDIASFAGTTLVFTIFPFAAELGARGKNAHALVCKSFAAVIGVNLALALVLAFCGAPLLRILPFGESYAEYAWGIPWMIAIVTVNTLPNLHIAAESAAMRFGYMRWWVPLHILYGLLLLAVTGYGYFANWLPAGLNAFLSTHNVTTLSALFMWMSVFALVKSVFCVFGLISPSPGSSAASGNATACSRSDAT